MRQNLRIISLVVLLLLSPLFFVGGPDSYELLSLRAWWEVGHVLIFALASLIYFNFNPLLADNACPQFLRLIFAVSVLSIVIEVIQLACGRFFEWWDLVRNLIGACFGYAVSLYINRGYSNRVILILGLSMLSVFLACADAIKQTVADYDHINNLPMLADMESGIAQRYFSGSAKMQFVDIADEVKGVSGLSGMVLKIEFPPEKYPGFSFVHFYRDWQGYKQFAMSIYNPQRRDLLMTCKLLDQAHIDNDYRDDDRYQKVFRVRPGASTLSVDFERLLHAPKDRLMELSMMRKLQCYLIRPKNTPVLYVDNIALKTSQ